MTCLIKRYQSNTERESFWACRLSVRFGFFFLWAPLLAIWFEALSLCSKLSSLLFHKWLFPQKSGCILMLTWWVSKRGGGAVFCFTDGAALFKGVCSLFFLLLLLLSLSQLNVCKTRPACTDALHNPANCITDVRGCLRREWKATDARRWMRFLLQRKVDLRDRCTRSVGALGGKIFLI